MLGCVPVLRLHWSMTDCVVQECASCLDKRGPLSQSDPIMNNKAQLYLKLLIPLTVISCLSFPVDAGPVFPA